MRCFVSVSGFYVGVHPGNVSWRRLYEKTTFIVYSSVLRFIHTELKRMRIFLDIFFVDSSVSRPVGRSFTTHISLYRSHSLWSVNTPLQQIFAYRCDLSAVVHGTVMLLVDHAYRSSWQSLNDNRQDTWLCGRTQRNSGSMAPVRNIIMMLYLMLLNSAGSVAPVCCWNRDDTGPVSNDNDVKSQWRHLVFHNYDLATPLDWHFGKI